MNNRIILYAFTGVTVIISVLLFSSVFNPLLNADDGVTILMLYDFNFPQDLYFWDQDRGGSIIPMLGQLFYKGFGISLLWSETITHYLILILGYFAFASLFKTNYSKLVFAVIWFLPLYYFLGLLRYSFGLHYSFLGMGIYFITLYQSGINHKPIIKYLLLSAIFFMFVLSVWSSDMAIVSISIVLFYLAFTAYQQTKSVKQVLKMPETWMTFLATTLGLLAILGLKSTAKLVSASQYNTQYFNTYDEQIGAFYLLKKILGTFFSFSVNDPPISIYAYLVVILLALILMLKIKGQTVRTLSPWAKVFVLDGLAIIAMVLISNWAYRNGLARRYFTGAYISFSIVLLLYLERVVKNNYTTLVKAGVVLLVMIGAFSTLYSYQYIRPKHFTPKANIVQEFEQLGKIGIIADYWSSYGVSFVNPEYIKATPHDKSAVRNLALVDSVFNQPKLYVIRDGWMDTFPDTMHQFGRKLTKKGNAFYMGNCWVNEYQVEH